MLQHIEEITRNNAPILLCTYWDIAREGVFTFDEVLQLHKHQVENHPDFRIETNDFSSLIEAAARAKKFEFATTLLRELVHWHLNEQHKYGKRDGLPPIDLKLLTTYYTKVVVEVRFCYSY